jgi:hypothetical protein
MPKEGDPRHRGPEKHKSRETQYGKKTEVLMAEYGITIAQDPKPILITHGFAACTVAVGYSPQLHVGFLGHYHARNDFKESVELLREDLLRLLQDTNARFRVQIRGGLDPFPQARKDVFEQLFQANDPRAMARVLAQMDDAGPSVTYAQKLADYFNLATDRQLGFSAAPASGFPGQLVAGIDTRTGRFIDRGYDPKRNPFARHVVQQEAYARTPRRIYFPR